MPISPIACFSVPRAPSATPLNRHLDIIWLSTPQLVQAIGEPKAQSCRRRRQQASGTASKDRRRRKSCCRGKSGNCLSRTGVHVAEHHFLKPSSARCWKREPQTVFEVFAGNKARQIWRGMDRVTVKAPVSWPQYLVYAGTAQVDIMLVPLAPIGGQRQPRGHKVHRCRQAWCGRAFSDALAYDGGPQDAHPRLPYDERVWIEEILRLVDDPEMRAARAADIAAKVAQMSRSFAPLFPEL